MYLGKCTANVGVKLVECAFNNAQNCMMHKILPFTHSSPVQCAGSWTNILTIVCIMYESCAKHVQHLRWVVVTTGLLVFKHHPSRFYLSALSRLEFVSLRGRGSISCPPQTHGGSAGTNTGWVTKKNNSPGCARRLALPLPRARSASLRGWITFLLLPSDVSLSYIGACTHTHTHTHTHTQAYALLNTHTHTHTQSDKSSLLPKSR